MRACANHRKGKPARGGNRQVTDSCGLPDVLPESIVRPDIGHSGQGNGGPVCVPSGHLDSGEKANCVRGNDDEVPAWLEQPQQLGEEWSWAYEPRVRAHIGAKDEVCDPVFQRDGVLTDMSEEAFDAQPSQSIDRR